MRRAAVLALLLVVPALAGCLGGSDDVLPLAGADAPPQVEDPGGHVAGREVVLEAAPVREGATYAWTLDGRTYPGPVLRVTLGAGSYEAVLVVDDGGVVHEVRHAFEVAAAGDADTDAGGGDGTDADGDAGDGSDPDDAGGDDAEADPCGFGGESIDVEGRGFEFTFSFPWSCQPGSWEWDLGDGTRSREGSVTHQYRRDGEYLVALTVVHDGQTHAYSETVQVSDVPLRIVPTIEGETATYALAWGRDVASAAWDLGDGTTSTEVKPTVTYPHAGPWAVTATATDAAGKTATATRLVSLDAYPLRVDAAVEQDTAALSFRWGWAAESVEWALPPGCSFVDGTDAADAEPTVRCGRPGIHTVRLDVAGAGRSATATVDLDIQDVPLRIRVTPDPDQADRMTFSALWHGDLSGIRWDLGDGTTSTEASPSHAYRAYGTFPVTLDAVADGTPRTAEAEVEVTDVPLRVGARRLPDGVWEFSLDWVASPESIAWDLGDGTAVLDQATVQHAYAFKGTYTVGLAATSAGRTKTWTGDVEVPVGTRPDWGDPATVPVRPGVQMASGGLQCTTSFLFHEDWSRYFLATAAHCVGTAGGTAGQQFSDDCDENESFDAGTEVTFKDWRDGQEALTGRLAYSSWEAMSAAGVADPTDCKGNDFALVEVDRGDVGKVHPAVLHFGGPVAAGAEGPRQGGSSVRSYGASSTRNPDGAVGDGDAVNAKGGQYVGHDGWHHTVRLDTPAVQGDSGGPLLTQGGEALGVLSTVSADGTNQFTDLAKAVAWMEAHTELDVELVTWGTWDGRTPPSGGLGGLGDFGDLGGSS